MGSQSFLSAALWLEHLASGAVAAAIGTIAVAAIGLATLAGRMRVRRGLEIVTGLFIIFGAPVISRGLVTERPADQPEPPPSTSISRLDVRPPAMTAYDPYAGASVPQTQPSGDMFARGQ
jgi:hypothetical protein